MCCLRWCGLNQFYKQRKVVQIQTAHSLHRLKCVVCQMISLNLQWKTLPNWLQFLQIDAFTRLQFRWSNRLFSSDYTLVTFNVLTTSANNFYFLLQPETKMKGKKKWCSIFENSLSIAFSEGRFNTIIIEYRTSQFSVEIYYLYDRFSFRYVIQ